VENIIPSQNKTIIPALGILYCPFLQLIFMFLFPELKLAEQLQSLELFNGVRCAQHLATEPKETFLTFLPVILSF